MFKTKSYTPQLNHHSTQSKHSRTLAQALPTSHRRWNSYSHKPAFTIIEVVLVLAIAGLIFLMVFIALPALQRSQRDTQRKQDVDRMYDATNRWLANNRGRTIRNLHDIGGMNHLISSGYLGEDYKDPDGDRYGVRFGVVEEVPTVQKDSNITILYRFIEAKCSGESTVAAPGESNFAISIVLEGGGVYCVSNS
ncbi:MAG: type II secretion system protein [Candidatus Sacchiramonaceae bacterium]|nr:type II secretion system protein [Candidatus Saccharimonadaceae bacterium]